MAGTLPSKDALLQNHLALHRPEIKAYEKLYKELHANGELSFCESETAKTVAEHLRKLSADLDIRTNIGGHGLVAILKNGPGKTVMLRADMDALPVAEKTGLDYASTKTMKDVEGVVQSVMHACGHDFHITCGLAAAETLLSTKDTWSGTIIFLFQPAEEKGMGSNAMIKDGLYDPEKHSCPKPDLVLGQHVVAMPAGMVGTRPGTIMSAADSFKITVFGHGGHGSMPHQCIDPVLIASHIVVRLQSVISRETPPDQTAVVTVGALNAGKTENIIADEAELKVNIRTMNPKVRESVLASVKRIVRAECVAGNCPKEPTFERISEYPLTVNDADVNEAVSRSFTEYFGDKHIRDLPPVLASEDFGNLGSAIDRPYCFWFWGGHDAKDYEKMKSEGNEHRIPGNHSPFFAPVIQPTLTTGVDALVVAALTFLKKQDD